MIAAWRARVGGIPEPRMRASLYRLAQVFAAIPKTVHLWQGGEEMITEPCEVVDQWKAEQAAKTGQDFVLRLLRTRFGAAMRPMEARVRQVADEERLALLLDAAYSAADLAEFERELVAG